MAKTTIKAVDLGMAITQELTIYHRGIISGIDFESQKCVANIAKETRKTAPVGARGAYRKNITSGLVKKTKRGNTYAWYVKAPDYRLTHLLVHGHATKDGGRTKSNPFLHNATNRALDLYAQNVEEVFAYYGKPRHYPGEDF